MIIGEGPKPFFYKYLSLEQQQLRENESRMSGRPAEAIPTKKPGVSNQIHSKTKRSSQNVTPTKDSKIFFN